MYATDIPGKPSYFIKLRMRRTSEGVRWGAIIIRPYDAAGRSTHDYIHWDDEETLYTASEDAERAAEDAICHDRLGGIRYEEYN